VSGPLLPWKAARFIEPVYTTRNGRVPKVGDTVWLAGSKREWDVVAGPRASGPFSVDTGPCVGIQINGETRWFWVGRLEVARTVEQRVADALMGNTP